MPGPAHQAQWDADLQTIVAAARYLAGLGLSPGSSGNLSIRTDAGVLVTPGGASLAELEADGLCLVDLDDGHLLYGGRPTKEVPLHLAMYRRAPSAGAIVHLHSPYATAWACLAPEDPNSAVPPVTPYFLMKVGRTPMLDYSAPGSLEMTATVERPDVGFECALMRRHGQLVAKPTMAAAVEAAVELEATCRILCILGEKPYTALSQQEIDDLGSRYPIVW